MRRLVNLSIFINDLRIINSLNLKSVRRAMFLWLFCAIKLNTNYVRCRNSSLQVSLLCLNTKTLRRMVKSKQQCQVLVFIFSTTVLLNKSKLYLSRNQPLYVGSFFTIRLHLRNIDPCPQGFIAGLLLLLTESRSDCRESKSFKTLIDSSY